MKNLRHGQMPPVNFIHVSQTPVDFDYVCRSQRPELAVASTGKANHAHTEYHHSQESLDLSPETAYVFGISRPSQAAGGADDRHAHTRHSAQDCPMALSSLDSSVTQPLRRAHCLARIRARNEQLSLR
jgi:hypothetical protein